MNNNIFTVKKWQPTIVWNWNHSDTCGICKNSIHDLCIECQISDTDNKCILSLGKCNHIFHHHCISKWIEIRDKCPLCQKYWELEKTEDFSS